MAKQTTELLGRAPTPSEWQFWMAYYSSQGCSTSTLATFGVAVAEGTEFTNDYPEATDKAERVLALVRAVYNHEPNSNDWAAYYTPYANGSMTWNQVVNAIFNNGVFAAYVVPGICNPSTPDYRWGGGTPYVIPASGSGPRTESQLQSAINTTAANGGGTVWLDPGSVIPISGSLLQIPAGVTVATTGDPRPTQYALMARLVPAGRICISFVCGYVSVVAIAGGTGTSPGGSLQSVWVDGNNTGESNPSPTYNFQLANVETTSGNGIQLINDRFTDPPPNGAAIRAQGASETGTTCNQETISGNLITGYAGSHSLSTLGRGMWSDGISDSCEGATISGNSLVDITGQGITVRGDYNRTANTFTTQASQVTNNTDLSAGADAFTAFGADQVGECLGVIGYGITASGDFPVPCMDVTDQSSATGGGVLGSRPFTGATISNNTFWSGPRSFFHVGLMVGSEALYGDNAAKTFGTGLSVTNNSVGVTGTQVNVGLAVGGMLNATVSGNNFTSGSGGNLTLVNATPNIPDNPCAQVAVGQAQSVSYQGVLQSGATLVNSQSIPAVNNDAAGPTAPPSLYGCLVPDAPPNGLETITTATSGGNQIFQGATSGNQFIPWGENYGGANTDTTNRVPIDPNNKVSVIEDAWTSNWSGMVATIREQKQMGATVLRPIVEFSYFVDPPSAGHPNGTPDQAHLAELSRFMNLAKQNGMYIDLTGLGDLRTIRTAPTDASYPSCVLPTQYSYLDELGSTGGANQAFTLKNSPVVNGAIQAVVQTTGASAGTTWTQVSSFAGQGPTAQVYTLTQSGSTWTLTFGDGVNGAIPPSTSTIAIAYGPLSGGDHESQPTWYECLPNASARWAAQEVFWSSVASTLAGNPAVMDYDLANEPDTAKIASWVYPGTFGGYYYDQTIDTSGTSSPVDWINALTAAIRGAGDNHLVTVGELPGPGYGGFVPSSVATSNISYLSDHEYPSNATNGINDVKTFAQGKPVVVEETFDLNANLQVMSDFILGSRPYATGWLGQYGQYTLAQTDPGDFFGFFEFWGSFVVRMNWFISPLTTIQN